MASVDFVSCPKCHSRNWEDIPAAKEGEPVRFRCFRCKHTIRLGGCARCKAKRWIPTGMPVAPVKTQASLDLNPAFLATSHIG